MKFNVEIVENGKQITLNVEGHFDEHAVLPPVDLNKFNKIIFNTEKVMSINSVGVRTWIKWTNLYFQKCEIIYVKCPKIIIDQMNMVGQLLKNAKVESFYTPYFCEACNASFPVLYTRGKEFTDLEIKVQKNVNCPKCQGSAELDVIEKTYFKFLNIKTS